MPPQQNAQNDNGKNWYKAIGGRHTGSCETKDGGLSGRLLVGCGKILDIKLGRLISPIELENANGRLRGIHLFS